MANWPAVKRVTEKQRRKEELTELVVDIIAGVWIFLCVATVLTGCVFAGIAYGNWQALFVLAVVMGLFGFVISLARLFGPR